MANGVPSHVKEIAGQSEVKDKYLMAFVDQFAAAIAKKKTENRKAKRPQDEGVRELVQSLLEGKDPSKMINPLLRSAGMYYNTFLFNPP